LKQNTLRIVTRKSPLAMWQAEHVKARLEAAHAGLRVELIGISTQGDKMLQAPLATVGGKGLFVKELEVQLLESGADIAVHSMKDVPVDLPDGLHLPVVLEREDPRDALIAGGGVTLEALPFGARIGTSSLRRQCQLRAGRPDLEIGVLRGNVGTRLGRLDQGDFDAIILAAAGVRRLGLSDRIAQLIEPEVMLPAIGQGVIGIECRVDDKQTAGLVGVLHDASADVRLRAERTVNAQLNGGCQVPVAAYAVIEDDELWLRGLVASLDGATVLRSEARAPLGEAQALGEKVAADLLDQGAAAILDAVMA